MYNLFKRPIENASLEAWAKLADDVAKVAILAIPVVLYGTDPFPLKFFNSLLLLTGIYTCLLGGRLFRQTLQRKDRK
ncbi:hypothetical protein L4G92_05795 [Neisseria sp. ZJ106]|uniref:CDP-diacylglycerol--glycerol-3-phosphate 3-phosphatidyltransferase n=1 Tax=Neisseria lisongii TaxID=2912188 RepID=A0AAW5AMN9_9NEIS|nr:hypothetical protein [Neisseria lisongii]MCF7521559.1 hypothetical protein [Neisseria lisongii]MCF7529701.1 hypothetical protein [Neisseria lisongii]WCL71836.1 hypothetical protein PJU73_01540 [Neisseria lisongii]